MFFMYVDESGDCGLTGSPTKYFALSGLTFHEAHWHSFMQSTLQFRKFLKATYGYKLSDEIHAGELLRKAYLVNGVPLEKHKKLMILRDYTRFLQSLNYLSITNVIIDKSNKTAGYDVFLNAWRVLFQRFENTVAYNNFPGLPVGSSDNYGLIFCDNTDGQKLNGLMRKMSVYNPVPNTGGQGYRDLPVRKIIEDPNMRNSHDSYFIQSADVAAYMLYQYFAPNSYIKKKTGRGFFKHLAPVLNTRASRQNTYGIVIQ